MRGARGGEADTGATHSPTSLCPAPAIPLCPSSAAESDRGFKKKHVTHLPVIEALLIQEMFFFSFLLFFPFVLAITLAQ